MSAFLGRRQAFIVALCLLFTLIRLPKQVTEAAAEEVSPTAAVDYPKDPIRDVPWQGGFLTLADVEAAFNFGRSTENSQLSVFIRPVVMPSPAEWSAKSDGDKVLWLINEERTARGLLPLHGLEKNANEVSQGFAKWLLENDAFDHKADESDPVTRLNTKPAISACHDSLGISENLWVQFTTSPDEIPFVVEQAVYNWIYADAIQPIPWGHRHAILWTPYDNNSGAGDDEGFIGFGRARGSYTIEGTTWPNTEMLVLNFFDPCPTWEYAAAPVVPAPSPPDVEPPAPTPGTRSVSGVTRLPVWQTVEYQPFEPTSWPDSRWAVSETGDGDYRWAARNCRAFAGTSSAMALGGGTDGSQTACAAEYPSNANSWLIYGPFDLSDAVMADFSAMVWVYTEPYVDILCLAASTDLGAFNGPCISGASIVGEDEQGAYIGWVKETLDLKRVYRMGSLLGKPQVYVALVFQTNGSVSRPHMGVYADDVTLRKAVLGAGVDSAAGNAGDPLYGVLISDETGKSATSDNDGSFTLTGLTPAVHTLTPTRPGYQFFPPHWVVDLTAGDVQNLAFVAVSGGGYQLSLPLLRRTTTTVRSAAAPSPLVRHDSSFAFECDASGCTMRGPLP